MEEGWSAATQAIKNEIFVYFYNNVNMCWFISEVWALHLGSNLHSRKFSLEETLISLKM